MDLIAKQYNMGNAPTFILEILTELEFLNDARAEPAKRALIINMLGSCSQHILQYCIHGGI